MPATAAGVPTGVSTAVSPPCRPTRSTGAPARDSLKEMGVGATGREG